jgi:hypothetical protein
MMSRKEASMAGERTTQVNLWMRAHLDDYYSDDDGLDTGAACLAAIEHFNAIPGFWKDWVTENLLALMGDAMGRTLGDARRGKVTIGSADAAGETTDATREPVGDRLLGQLQRKIKRATIADLLGSLELKARKWEQHYELVGERKRVLVLDMTRAEYRAAAALRRKSGGLDVAIATVWDFIADQLTADEQRGSDLLTYAQLTELFESMGAASARPATQSERMVAD